MENPKVQIQIRSGGGTVGVVASGPDPDLPGGRVRAGADAEEVPFEMRASLDRQNVLDHFIHLPTVHACASPTVK